MELKDLIKKRRQELGLTYEQLGNLIGVGKSTVRKWETGMVENMRRDNIIALSKALNLSPALLMGWDIEENYINNSVLKFSDEELQHIESFRKLNIIGRKKVSAYTNDLIDSGKYEKSEPIPINKKQEIWEEEGKEHLMPIACHDDNLTEEEKSQMDKIINDYLKNNGIK